MKKIAVFGGSFDPPGLHTRRIVQELRKHFDEVVVVPCGPRPDKPLDHIDPVHRAALADLTFRGLDGVKLDLSDLELARFTPTDRLDARFKASGDGEVWHVVGSEQIAGGRDGQSFIHRVWERGPELWRQLNYAVLGRRGHEIVPADLPPRSRVIPIGPDCDGSAELLRKLLAAKQSVDGRMTPGAADYAVRHKLYRQTNPARGVSMKLPDPRLFIYYDDYNKTAKEWADHFRRYEVSSDPNCILVIGGDGTMLKAIRQFHRLRAPFFGINSGHLGYLHNRPEEVIAKTFPPAEIISRPMPLLYVEMERADGTWVRDLTFNDAWVQREKGQTAWLEVLIDGKPRLPELIADGLLVATAAGSTAYARSMGVTPLLADTPAWLIVGSNVMQPVNWKTALLSLDAKVEVRNREPDRRPLEGYIYADSVGRVVTMKARVSRIAAVELAFAPGHDIADKITEGYFRGVNVIPARSSSESHGRPKGEPPK